MIPRKLEHDYYMLCGIDRRLEKFENMFTLPRGISYNSYFLDDEKTAVLDSIDQAVAEEFMEALDLLLAGRQLDILVCNHAEPDHGATLVRMMEKYPECRLYTSKLCYQFLCQFYPVMTNFAERVVEVDEGEGFNTGKHEITFIKAPNVHWPEVTVCFDKSTGYLFSADAFGSFAAPDGYIFSDQVNFAADWLSEYRRYYTNIVGRHGASVSKLLEKIDNIEVKCICPLHGMLFRKAEDIAMIIDKYKHWSTYTAEEAGTTIIYGSLYDNSARMADVLAAYLAQEETGAIRVYDVSKTNVSELIADLFRFSNAVFICNNYNTELYPPMDALLRELMMLNWDNHKYSLIGSKSWGGRGVKIAQEILSRAKNLQEIGESFTITSSLKEEDLGKVQELAKAIKDSM